MSIETEIYQGKCLLFTAFMDDGSKVFVQFEDKGEKVPGYDKNKNRYDAYTSWWRLTFPKPRGPNGEQIQENYVQVEKSAAILFRSGVNAARWMADETALNAMGVDTLRGLTEITDAAERQAMSDLQRSIFTEKLAS